MAALVLLTGRRQGLRALVGFPASLAVIVFFVVPAILEGTSPPAVAFVGALAVMFAAALATRVEAESLGAVGHAHSH